MARGILGVEVLYPLTSLQAINYNRWMGDAAETIGDVPLWQLFVPATHDSGTYALLQPWERPADDRYAPDETSDRFLIDLGRSDHFFSLLLAVEPHSISRFQLDTNRSRLVYDTKQKYRGAIGGGYSICRH